MSSFTHIRTSKDNHERVVELTRKFGFGAENVAARVALATSLANGKRMDINRIQNSVGKEYRTSVLFGKHVETYVSMIAVKYGLHRTNKDIPKLIKMHIDDGIEVLHDQISEQPGRDTMHFLFESIERSLSQLNK
ncbi:MAG: DndE family protein [Flavobacteriales bacterium]